MTKNFSIEEFQCKCGCDMPDDVMENVKKLAEELQVIRSIVESPITINSAYRCPAHNESVQKKYRKNYIPFSSTSQHLLGKASDIVVKGHTPSDTHSLLDDIMNNEVIINGGLGKYNTFTHYDIRDKKARW